MIAKIGRGENLFGALAYNKLKVDNENGQIIATHKMIETYDGRYTLSQLARSFEPYLIANNKTEKPVLHISLNPNPNDQVSDEKFQDIAQDYMEQMGYGNQPYVVFKHTDIDRTHIHIVSVCIDEEGKKISDTFDKRRSVKITRELELKYNLLPTTEKEHSQNHKIFRPVDYQKGNLKSQIASVVRHLPAYYKFQSMGEYNALLSLFNITSELVKGELYGVQKEGIIYSALSENGEKTGSPLKASLFGKNAGLTELRRHFEKSKEDLNKESSKIVLTSTVEMAMQATSDEISFKKQLQEQGINTVVRRTEDGRIYGITFIDHNSKTVWNGSRLGKQCSANVFNEWWNHQKGQEVKTERQHETAKSPHKKYVKKTDDKPHRLFDFLSKTGDTYSGSDAGFLEGLGGLLPQSQGEDYDELVFENQMKKKKKRKPGRQT